MRKHFQGVLLELTTIRQVAVMLKVASTHGNVLHKGQRLSTRCAMNLLNLAVL